VWKGEKSLRKHHNRGKLLVSFRPGDAIGHYNWGEDQLFTIAQALGDFSDRVFDMYFEFSQFADQGLLLRQEHDHHQGAIVVSFYYPKGIEVYNRRKMLVNRLLGEYLASSIYPRPNLYVAQLKDGNYQLISKAKRKMSNCLC